MSSVRRMILAIAAALAVASQACAQADPLRFVPAEAELLLKINDPKKLAEAVYKHDAVQDWYKIDGVREFFDTTNYRRLFQLIAHYEKTIGMPAAELYDRLAGGGVVFAARFS